MTSTAAANNVDSDQVWLLENKDWEYLNFDHLVENCEHPTGFQSMKVHRCKLEATCIQYLEKMVREKSAGTELRDAIFTNVSMYGQTEQINVNFGRLLNVLFSRKVNSLTINHCPQVDLKLN